MTTAIHHPLHVLLVVLYLLCINASSYGSSESVSKDGNLTRCVQKEREALLLFKQSLVNQTHLLESWNKEQEGDCCKWKGVACDYRTGHVTHLLLSSLLSPFSPSSPYGPYPTNSTGVTIGHSLLDLPYLTYLDLSSNYLARIPDFIGSLKKLVHLDCSNTWAGGSIPSQIGNLSNLQYLNLSFNNFDGPIPKSIGTLNRLRYLDCSNTWANLGSFPSRIGNLSNLQYLNLSFSYNFDGPIPKSIGSLNSLRYLDLSWSGFTGVIPQELGNLSNLQYLNLSLNIFDGPIPKSIGSLNSLRYLDLSNSWIPGVIPHELGNLSKLQHLDLGYNFILKGGKNFNWLFNLSSLTHLDLSGIKMDPPSIWPSFIQRIPSLSVLRLIGCSLSAPSSNVSNISSSISTLHLRYNRINSSIFDWIYHLSGSLVDLDLGTNDLEGRIPESFGHMTALTHLHLYDNQLTGVLCNLSSLQVADFSSNNFTGNLEEILSGPFPLLEVLYISGNQLTGSLPDITLHSNLIELEVNSNQLNGNLPTVFEHHSALRNLDLSNNHLRGSLPDFTGFSSLAFLNLENNEFFGSIPDFTGCSSLEELQLGENRLTEWETQSIGLLYNLWNLDLAKNSIHSTITEAHLSNLSSLSSLITSFNSITFEFSPKWIPPFKLRELSLASCKVGPTFPNWIRNQSEIRHLDISNSQISDTIPVWFWNLSSMSYLNLSSNNIRGRFSCKLIDIVEIDLSSNHFYGPLPTIPAYCSKINLSQNKFSGTLLSLSVVEDLSLGYLDVSHNQLFGALPDIWMHFRSLAFLNLGYNNFSGRVPTSVGHLLSLQTLILRNNKLYGELPASLRNCSNLGFVDFGLNKLSGKIPSWIGKDLPQLYALILKSNTFNGSLPNAICHLRNLHFLDLSINKISGTIPLCFGNLSAMSQNRTEVSEHNYSAINSTGYYIDNVLARWKGQEFEYGRNFAYLKMIDLSTNELTGEIPLGITRLLELKGLNLSGNRFYGKVPPEIGELKLLECLDLSTNKFSGEIPQSMSGLNFLAFLNLSNNNFSGKIPSGTQLQGFNISTYEGNTGLCGKPLTNTCPGEEPSDKSRPSIVYDVDEDNSEYERWLYISAILGFSTTFWGFIGTLVLNRRWRHAYFMFLHDLKERFYVAMAVRIARFQRKV